MIEAPLITGLGVVCPLGTEPQGIVERLWRGESAFREPDFACGVLQGRRIAEVSGLESGSPGRRSRSQRYMSRETHLASAALQRCRADAALPAALAPEQLALFAGTGSSGLDLSCIDNMLRCSSDQAGRFDIQAFGREGLGKMNPLLSFRILPNMPVAVAAIEGGIRGNNLIFNPWEGNALQALDEARYELAEGRSRAVFCGGSDCKTHSDAFLAAAEYGLFDRSDMVMGEGSAYLCLERHQDAAARGVRGYALLRSLVSRSLVPSTPGAYSGDASCYGELICAALSQAQLKPEQLDLVIDSRDYQYANDRAEEQALEATLGTLPRLSPKRVAGNCFAAAGFIAVALAAWLLGRGRLPDGRPLRRLLVTSFANGSEKFCLILERP